MSKLSNVILLVILIPLTHFSHLFLNNIYNNQSIKIDEKFNLPSPEITQVASIGYDNFIADLLWLQFIQYFGNTTDMSIILPELYSLLNNIITLDPKFTNAYIVGAYALVDNKEFDKAVNILETGVKANREEWYLSYQVGFLYYIFKKNKPMAARYLEKASNIKGSPPFLKKIAATLYSDTGSDLEIKIQLWQSVYDKARQEGDQINMEKASKKLSELKIEKDLETLRNAIKKYQENNKASENTVYPDAFIGEETMPEIKASPLPPLREIRDLVDMKLLDKVPLDPFNRSYIFNDKTQEVEAFPLPWQQSKVKGEK